MKRVVIKFKDKELDHMNIVGDYIVRDGDFVLAYNGDNLIAIIRQELINLICISEKQTKENGKR